MPHLPELHLEGLRKTSFRSTLAESTLATAVWNAWGNQPGHLKTRAFFLLVLNKSTWVSTSGTSDDRAASRLAGTMKAAAFLAARRRSANDFRLLLVHAVDDVPIFDYFFEVTPGELLLTGLYKAKRSELRRYLCRSLRPRSASTRTSSLARIVRSAPGTWIPNRVTAAS